ncbi:MAG: adenosine deaminase [Acidimicrobiia bacterium]
MPLPSVLLHDHLDGGLRADTVLELADEIGYDELPTLDPSALGNWFDQSESGSLERYLQSFDHTIAVMQTQSALTRVAKEAVHDLWDDGVVYAELRFSPPLHTMNGLGEHDVIEAVADGMRQASRETGLKWALIIDALRDRQDSEAVARLALAHRGDGVVGFDIAGPEKGFPPAEHIAAFRVAREGGLRLTIHAGESAGSMGIAYIKSAMDTCGAERIGHGNQIIEDCVVEDGRIVSVGPVARLVLDRQMPLELCPSSNLATGGVLPEQHPIGPLYRAGFNVTVSTDNRLMSATSMSAELDFARKFHGFDVSDIARVTRQSLEAAFCAREVKEGLWQDVLAPSFLSAGAAIHPGWS